MSKVVLDVSVSPDGFTASPNVREAGPMGDGGERLHVWMAGTGPDGQIAIDVRRGGRNRRCRTDALRVSAEHHQTAPHG